MKTSLVNTYFKVGNQLLREKKFEQAVKNYTKVVKISPHFGTYCNLGIALKNLGLLDEALVAYKRAMKLKPKRAEVYNNIGNVYTAAGDVERAIKHYERAINIKPNYLNAYENLIEIYLSLGKTRKAINLQSDANKIIRNKQQVLK
jgi:protein O-GlcNAc transferase